MLILCLHLKWTAGTLTVWQQMPLEDYLTFNFTQCNLSALHYHTFQIIPAASAKAFCPANCTTTTNETKRRPLKNHPLIIKRSVAEHQPHLVLCYCCSCCCFCCRGMPHSCQRCNSNNNNNDNSSSRQRHATFATRCAFHIFVQRLPLALSQLFCSLYVHPLLRLLPVKKPRAKPVPCVTVACTTKCPKNSNPVVPIFCLQLTSKMSFH